MPDKVKEAFKNLTTAKCEIAAEMYVNACVKGCVFELENLLLQVPPVVGKRELYLSLAKAMESAKGRHVRGLLESAGMGRR